MRTFRRAGPMKLVMAATVLAIAFTTPPVGHAHERPHPPRDDHHLAWADHDHSAEPWMAHDAHPHPEDSIVGGSVFHLHGTWFGIPFSLPSPVSHRTDPHPLADDLATTAVTLAAQAPRTGLQPAAWPPCPQGCGSPLTPAALVSDHLLRASPPPDAGAGSPCALRARTTSLRC